MGALPALSFAPMEHSIGALVEKRMKAKGVSMVAMAAAVSVSRNTLRKYLDDNSMDVPELMKMSVFLGHNFFQDLSDEFRKRMGMGMQLMEPNGPAYGKQSTLRVVIEMDRDDERAREIATKLVRDMDPGRTDPPTVSVTE